MLVSFDCTFSFRFHFVFRTRLIQRNLLDRLFNATEKGTSPNDEITLRKKSYQRRIKCGDL